ncbi:MAG: ABC transporter ATP-binding protein [SAR202 cluster bacterium]|nr:ABC transporter ATP-binding protein [SAR202 cluster bacterium]|tara:strand:+ start:378 stop:1427 length:1050 start_codon:yes stop_codon:yes gene_type:complete
MHETKKGYNETVSSSSSTLVQIKKLQIQYTVRTGLFRKTPLYAVNDVTLNIPQGETTALVGESGSGKTTLGKATLRLLDPVAGTLLFDGKDITKTSQSKLKPFRRRAQEIFQDPYASINPSMTIFQSIEEPLLIHDVGDSSERRRLVYEALNDVRLTPPDLIGSSYPHSLSGGQRQRVSIARSIVLRPDYIVADEAISMVDASSRMEIINLLKNLQHIHGITFLYITHDIATAQHFADKIAVMYMGKIVELGTPKQIVQNPLHPYTQGLIAAIPEPDPNNRFHERPVVTGDPPDPLSLPNGCLFNPRCLKKLGPTCEMAIPILEVTENNHAVACHLYPNASPNDPNHIT